MILDVSVQSCNSHYAIALWVYIFAFLHRLEVKTYGKASAPCTIHTAGSSHHLIPHPQPPPLRIVSDPSAKPAVISQMKYLTEGLGCLALSSQIRNYKLCDIPTPPRVLLHLPGLESTRRSLASWNTGSIRSHWVAILMARVSEGVRLARLTRLQCRLFIGCTCNQGAVGPPGPPGNDGAAGNDGTPGQPGPDGKNAEPGSKPYPSISCTTCPPSPAGKSGVFLLYDHH